MSNLRILFIQLSYIKKKFLIYFFKWLYPYKSRMWRFFYFLNWPPYLFLLTNDSPLLRYLLVGLIVLL